MIVRRLLTFFTMLVIVAVPSSPSFAQSTTYQPDETLPGFKANDVLLGGAFDNVSLFSGDTGLVVPLGPAYPLTPNVTFQLKAYNTFKFWRLLDSTCNTDTGSQPVTRALVNGFPSLGAGWTLSPGYVMPANLALTGHTYIYVSPDGSQHVADADGLMRDNSRLRITCNSPNPPWTTCTVWFPDGSTQLFNHSMPQAGTGPNGDFTLDTSPVLGLTTITDSFGSTALTIQYNPSPNAWEVQSISLNGSGSRHILFAWKTVPPLPWPVIDTLTFPAIAGANGVETIVFDYLPNGFSRNVADLTSDNNCTDLDPDYVNAPQLKSVTYNDNGTADASFAFGYSTDPAFSGSLTDVTMPSTGTIHYDLGYSFGKTTVSTYPPLTLETTDVPGTPAPPVPGVRCFICDSLGSSVAVATRTLNDTVRHVVTTTAFGRKTYVPVGYPNQATTNDQLTRVVEVTEPKDRSSTKMTRYLFHVPDLGDNDPSQGGVEIEHRVYDGTDLSAPNVRTVIDCEDFGGPTGFSAGSCGYLNAAGTGVNRFSISGQHPSGSVVWYGPKPSTTADDTGGTCPPLSGDTTKCISQRSTTWNGTAQQYKFTTTTSGNILNVDGGAANVNRGSYTDWTPVATGSDWLLNLFDKKSSYDGAQPPAEQSDGATVVSQWFEMDSSTGFITGVVGWDSPSTTQFVDCRYPASIGSPLEELQFTALEGSRLDHPCVTYFPTWPPIVNPSFLGTNSDYFGHYYSNASPSGLLQRAQWALGTQSGTVNPLVWNAFDVTRDISTGLVTSSRDPSAHQTTYAYDSLGRITSISPPNEAPTAITYDNVNQTTVQRTGTDGSSTWTVYRYDGLGRLVRETRQIPTNGGFATKPYYFDAAGNEYLIGEWIECSVSPTNCSQTFGITAADCVAGGPNANATTQCNYDPFGRATRTWRPDGSRTDVDRTDGSTLYSDTRELVNTYSADGTLVVGPYTTAKDGLGRVIGVTEPTAFNTRYGYNVLDKITCVIQGTGTLSPCSVSSGQKRTFAYNAFGFLKSELNPEISTTTSVNYTSGSLGNVLTKSAPGGNNFTFQNADAAGRPTSAAITSGSTYHLFAYDSGCTTLVKTTCGKLTSQTGNNPLITTAPVLTQAYMYSATDGKLASRSTTINPTIAGQQVFTDSWLYNQLGLISKYTHPKPSTGTAVDSTYTYSFGFPMTLISQGTTLASGVVYNPWGGLKSWLVPGGGGETITITADPSGMPRPLRSAITGSLLNFTIGDYSYDGAGDITLIGSAIYGYNKRGMLNSSNVIGTPVTYTIDNFGNVTSLGAVNASTNRLSTGATYDTLGNLTSYASKSYSYDPFSREKSATSGGTTESYIYDASDERVARIQPGNTPWFATLRDEKNELATEYTLTSSGYTRTKEYFHFGGVLAATEDMSTAIFTSWLSDHLGTPRRGVPTGGPIESHDYLPWGEEIGGSFGRESLKFAKMERDSLTLNDNDHARFHLTGLGRFVSVDKHAGSPGDPQTWNRYSYSRDNPLKFVDSNGQEFGYPGQQQELVRAENMNLVRAALANEGITSTGGPIEFLIGFGTGAMLEDAGQAAVEAATAESATAASAEGAAQAETRATFFGTTTGDVVPATTPAGQAINPHAAQRMAERGMTPSEADTVLATGATKINAENVRAGSVTFKNRQMVGQPQVTVSYSDGTIVTVTKNAPKPSAVVPCLSGSASSCASTPK